MEEEGSLNTRDRRWWEIDDRETYGNMEEVLLEKTCRSLV
jgi:hypothetical protein